MGIEKSEEHECCFVEEREPEGRVILPPCIECGCTAAQAIDILIKRIRQLEEGLKCLRPSAN